jgi:hypothetical protein
MTLELVEINFLNFELVAKMVSFYQVQLFCVQYV